MRLSHASFWKTAHFQKCQSNYFVKTLLNIYTNWNSKMIDDDFNIVYMYLNVTLSRKNIEFRPTWSAVSWWKSFTQLRSFVRFAFINCIAYPSTISPFLTILLCKYVCRKFITPLTRNSLIWFKTIQGMPK